MCFSIGPIRALYIIGGQRAKFSIGRRVFSFSCGPRRFAFSRNGRHGLRHGFKPRNTEHEEGGAGILNREIGEIREIFERKGTGTGDCDRCNTRTRRQQDLTGAFVFILTMYGATPLRSLRRGGAKAVGTTTKSCPLLCIGAQNVCVAAHESNFLEKR